MKIKLQEYSLISNEWIEKSIKVWENEIKNHKTNSFKYGYCQGKLMLLCELKKQLIPLEELPQQNDINVGYGDRIYDNEPKPKLPQQEISDEEIEKEMEAQFEQPNHRYPFYVGATWYREQLKQRQ